MNLQMKLKINKDLLSAKKQLKLEEHVRARDKDNLKCDIKGRYNEYLKL